MGYKPTHATIIDKQEVTVHISGLFGYKGSNTEYQITCRSDSGKVFNENLPHYFWKDLEIDDRLFFKRNEVKKLDVEPSVAITYSSIPTYQT